MFFASPDVMLTS